MLFEFDHVLKAQKTLEIDNIGEFAIQAIDNEGRYYYLICRTSLGMTSFVTYGPIVPGIPLLPGGFSTNLDRMPYLESKIAKKVEYFLNPKKTVIVEAEEISFDEAVDAFIDIKEYLTNFEYDEGF